MEIALICPTVLIAVAYLVFRVVKGTVSVADAGNAVVDAGLFLLILICLLLVLFVVGSSVI